MLGVRYRSPPTYPSPPRRLPQHLFRPFVEALPSVGGGFERGGVDARIDAPHQLAEGGFCGGCCKRYYTFTRGTFNMRIPV